MIRLLAVALATGVLTGPNAQAAIVYSDANITVFTHAKDLPPTHFDAPQPFEGHFYDTDFLDAVNDAGLNLSFDNWNTNPSFAIPDYPNNLNHFPTDATIAGEGYTLSSDGRIEFVNTPPPPGFDNSFYLVVNSDSAQTFTFDAPVYAFGADASQYSIMDEMVMTLSTGFSFNLIDGFLDHEPSRRNGGFSQGDFFFGFVSQTPITSVTISGPQYDPNSVGGFNNSEIGVPSTHLWRGAYLGTQVGVPSPGALILFTFGLVGIAVVRRQGAA